MIAEALKRTTLLMRTHLVHDTTDAELLDALTSTVVVIAADEAVLASYAGQCAITTAAVLAARSGHKVYLDLPDVPLIGRHPPLEGSHLIAALLDIGGDLIPGCQFAVGRPAEPGDLSVAFGAAPAAPAAQRIAVGAAAWSASLAPADAPAAWTAGEWPFGALAGAAMVAGEAFKASMRKLARRAASRMFDDWYAPTAQARIELADETTPLATQLGDFDMVSGGAIANAALYALLRVPGGSGRGRVLDDDRSALSNLNRNVLLRRSRLDLLKVDDLATYSGGLVLKGLPLRYGANPAHDPVLARTVLVGVDHIPSRWAVQRTGPGWLGVGATAEFTVQVSQHRPGLPCAGCAHPHDGGLPADIPTVAFVSFWSGLLLAVEHLREQVGVRDPYPQQRHFCALRPETWATTMMGLPANADCPVSHGREAAE